MPGPLTYVVWLLGILCEASVVVCALRARSFRKYFLLNLYMGGTVFVELSRYRILGEYGLDSPQYYYFYYYSDAVLTIFLYFALSSLYAQVFGEMKAERYVRMGTILLLALTALFTYLVVMQSSDRFFLPRFVKELSQNLYFVGLVLTYVLWGAILKLRETRARLVQFVLSLGVYFSLFAANYAIENLYPPMGAIANAWVPVLAMFLPVAWAYAFLKLPEDARLAPARLAVVPR